MPDTYLNRRKYLLLDSRIINTTENVSLRVGNASKHPANPLFGEDKPWEVRYDVSLVKGFCPVPVRVYAHFGHGFRTSQNTSVAHGQNPIRHR